MIEATPELRQQLLTCLAVPRFAEHVLSEAPFEGPRALLETAAAVASTLTDEEVDAALADHPRIGERHGGSGASAALSNAEQASADADDAALSAAIAAGNAAYEQRFGRVFLIRAAGRSRAEILSELQRRLDAEPDDERATVKQELIDIALRRLASLQRAS